jgi:RimJ/RimL family protein N-acetyltransferase
LDLSHVIENPEHIMLRAEDKTGGWLFYHLGNGIYECHSQFLPEGRGPHIPALAADALNWIFGNTDAQIILARCPLNNEPVTKLTKRMGFKYVGTWGDWIINGEAVPTARYQLTKENWERSQAKKKP